MPSLRPKERMVDQAEEEESEDVGVGLDGALAGRST